LGKEGRPLLLGEGERQSVSFGQEAQVGQEG